MDRVLPTYPNPNMARQRRAKQRIDYSDLTLEDEGEDSDDAKIPSSDEDEVLHEQDNLEADSEMEESLNAVDNASTFETEKPISFKQEDTKDSKEVPARPHRTYETMRERMSLFYGSANDELLSGVKIRRKWGDIMFMIPESLLLKHEIVEAGASAISSAIEPTNTDSPIPGSNIIVNDQEISPGKRLKASGVRILNAGGLVTAINWSPDGSHLAIGVVPGDPIEQPAVRSDLSSNSIQRGQGYIQIWKMTPEDIELEHIVDTGIPKQLIWRPCSDKEIAVVLQDGGLVIFAPTSSGSLVPRKFCLKQKATSVCWKDIRHLVVGTRDGCIAEFVVDEEMPSFVWPVHYSLINDIASGGPERASLIFTSSVDGFCKIIDLNDIRRSQASTPRHKLFSPSVSWCPLVESFVMAEDTGSTKLLPLRNPGIIRSGTSLTHHEGMLTSLATSRSHPLIISGASDGSVHVTNTVRRATTTRRTNKVHAEACLWTLECNERSGRYRFVEKLSPLQAGKHSKTDRITLYPKTVAITALDFAPGSSWFAAATASGIVRVESLEPRPN